jgi:S-formylglutathione hydrolase FrmB
MKKLVYKKCCLFIVSMVFTICGLSSESFGQGTVVNTSFYSESLGINRGIQIFLPQGYNQLDSAVRYPVIYFLHGLGVNHTYYTGLFSVFNNLILTQPPFIVVKPDGSAPPWGGSCYTNSELYGDFEDYIVYDLVEFIDFAYNTSPSREKRAIMGHSTGAFGAMKFALKHPDIYCGVVANSGPLAFKHFSDWIPLILAENGGIPVSLYNPYAGGGSSYWTFFFYSYAGAFSPNLTNSPYPVDFPLDSLGNWIDSVWNRWSVHDPTFLARNITQSSDLTIFFDCGTQDEYGVYPFSTAFADSLDQLGLSYVFQSFNGGHMNQMYTRFSIGFQFLDSVMNSTVGISEELTIQPKNFYLFQNYPNPFNPSTIISYQLPLSGDVTLKVYDIIGSEVARLVSENKQAGRYVVEFNAATLPSGVYFYRLQAGSFVETKKMLLLK